MATCTVIFQVSCLRTNMDAAVSRLGGSNFSAVTSAVHKGRGVPARSDLDRDDIAWITSRADIAPGLRGTVASGFMNQIDTSGDGRIDAREWAAGQNQDASASAKGLATPARGGVQLRQR